MGLVAVKHTEAKREFFLLPKNYPWMSLSVTTCRAWLPQFSCEMDSYEKTSMARQ